MSSKSKVLLDSKVLIFIWFLFQCKTCESDVEVVPVETRGFGFKIDVICEKLNIKKSTTLRSSTHTK